VPLAQEAISMLCGLRQGEARRAAWRNAWRKAWRKAWRRAWHRAWRTNRAGGPRRSLALRSRRVLWNS